MKSRTWMWTTVVYLFAAVAMPVWMTAQDNPSQNNKPKHHQYKLIDLGTFGGPNTYLFTQGVGAQDLSSREIVTGSADTPIPDPNAPNCFNSDCLVSHAFQWQDGVLTDLGALPGVNSSYGSWISSNGLIAGMSENSTIDPITGFPEERAVFWKDGNPIDLGTFGGNESLANAVNNRGQVVGLATNAIPDPFNFYGFGTQMDAFLWQNGVMRNLGTLGGPDSIAFWVNERGQVAGISYINSIPNPLTGLPTMHPFLWENGTMHDLGTIGGTQVFQLNGLNERGQVVGSMTLADEDPNHVHPFFWDGERLLDLGSFGGNFGEATWLNDAGEVVGHANTSRLCGGGQVGHAFLWTKGVLRDLGTVPGIDLLTGGSGAVAINSKSQIVGISNTCDFSVVDAFVWEKGSMADLNTLVPPGSAMHMFIAVYISDRGEITGFGTLPNGDVHTFLLTPCEGDDGGCQGDTPSGTTQNSLAAVAQRSTTGSPANPAIAARQRAMLDWLRSRWGQRYHFPGQAAAPRD